MVGQWELSKISGRPKFPGIPGISGNFEERSTGIPGNPRNIPGNSRKIPEIPEIPGDFEDKVGIPKKITGNPPGDFDVGLEPWADGFRG